jgi:probable F420-dependent oxidoreductase
MSEATWQAAKRWGRIGVGLAVPPTPAAVWKRELARLDKQRYGAVWINEGIGGRESFSQLGLLLAATDELVVGTGIANIWARHGAVMQAGAATLAEAHPGRVALGLGVSARLLVEQSGQTYGKPLAEMRAYLDRMDAAAEQSIQPPVPFPRLLAALGPKMLELARERADGAYPHTMPVEHTALARRILGPDKLLVVGVGVFLDTNRANARSRARQSGAFRLPGSPYLANLRRLGYPEDELADGPSDRILDAVFACGEHSVIAPRIREHLDAGADHVVLQPVGADLPSLIDQLEQMVGPADLIGR